MGLNKVSVIIPVFNSANTIQELVDRLFGLKEVFLQEVIFVDDSSVDNSWEVISDCVAQNNKIKAIQLGKNFGQHNAIMTGIRYTQGDICVVLDDDLQNPPEEMARLVNALSDSNVDVVYGYYLQQQQSIFRNLGSRINDYMANILIKKGKNIKLSSFFAFKSYLINEIIRYDGPYVYLPGILFRSTNRITNLLVDHQPRMVGKSNYTFLKLLRLWLYGFLSFSIFPIEIITYLGLSIFLICSLYIAYAIMVRIMNPAVPLGWTTIVAIVTSLGGLNIMFLGIIGEYVGRLFLTANKQPQSVVRKKMGF